MSIKSPPTKDITTGFNQQMVDPVKGCPTYKYIKNIWYRFFSKYETLKLAFSWVQSGLSVLQLFAQGCFLRYSHNLIHIGNPGVAPIYPNIWTNYQYAAIIV